MKNHALMNPTCAVRAAVIAMCALLAQPAAAQIQIPNPLMQPPPRKTASLKDEVKEPLPPMAGQQPPGRGIQEMGMPPQFGGPMNSPNQNGNSKTPFAEVRERLAPFYVSAIVGDRAILRRGAAQQIANPLNPNSMAMAPASMAAMSGVPGSNAPAVSKPNYGQTETMTVTDGEPIDFIGDGITLMPKVTSSRVSIYYSDDGAAPRKGAKRQVVFIGQVESTAAGVPTPIVLEKPDPTYKQKVSVETKSRSGNGGNGGSGQTTGSSPFGSQPQTNVNQ